MRPLRRAAVVAARWAPFVVPPCYLLLVFALQPRDHMGPPDAAPWLYSSLYDDYDATAMALRGLNFARGRIPGSADPPCQQPPHGLNQELDDPNLALKPRYHLEYPPAALLLFRLGWVGQSNLDSYPPAVLDGDYVQLVQHEPRNEQERVWWGQFRRAGQTYMLLMMACGLSLTAVLRAGYEPNGGLSSSGLLLLLPAALYFTLNRFDVLPALLVAVSLACLGRRFTAASAAFLAAATALKLFPLLLAPLILRYLLPDWRRAAAWVGCYAAVGVASLAPPLLMYGWPGLLEPLRFQLGREPSAFVLYGPLLPPWLAANDLTGRLFRLGTLAAAVVVVCATRPPDLASLLRRGAVVLIVFLCLSVYFSPQWVLWLAPFCLPLTRGNRLLPTLLIALDLITYYTFPVYAPVWGPMESGGMDRAVYARFLAFVALAAALLWQEWRAVRQAGAGPAPVAQEKVMSPAPL